MRKILLAFVVLISTWMPTASFAQDRCSDVLKDGVFQTANYRNNSYFRQIIHSRTARSSDNQVRNDTDGGFGVPLGEAVFGGKWSASRHESLKKSQTSSYFEELDSSREIDVALMSGDAVLLSHWSNCMRKGQGGLTARFQPNPDGTVTLFVEYFAQGSRYSDKIRISYNLPDGVEITGGESCLTKDTEILHNRPCIMTLKPKNDWQTFPIVVTGESSTAQAWLPARIKLVPEMRPYSFASADNLARSEAKRVFTLRAAVELTAEELAAGWSFDPASADARIDVQYLNHAKCDALFKEATDTRFLYGYFFYAPNRNHNPDGRANCLMAGLAIMMHREKWVDTSGQEKPVAVQGTGSTGAGGDQPRTM